jgi:DNA-binding FadR family transcriptional regulator
VRAARSKPDETPAPAAPVMRRAPIRIPKTAEVVADEIRRLITSGALGEGDTLQPEATIIADFHVSRPTIREAFRILESEQLISVARGSRGGARVHAPKPELVARYAGFVLQSRRVTYAEVYRARSIIEPPAARVLAETRAKGAPAALRQKIAEQKAAQHSGGFGRAVADFHTCLVELTGNGALILIASMLDGIVARHHTLSASRSARKPDPGGESRNFRAGMRSHEKLVALIEAGEGAEAEAHWRRHMDNAAKVWLANGAGEAIVTWSD